MIDGAAPRAGRSPPLSAFKFHTIIISKHQAKTPRTKKEKEKKEKEKEEKKENWGTAQPPPTRSGIA